MAVGATSSEIVRDIMPRFDVSERCVREDIRQLRDLWARESRDERPHRREQLYRMARKRESECWAKGDSAGSRGFFKFMMELSGLPMEKPIDEFTSDELKEILADLATGTLSQDQWAYVVGKYHEARGGTTH